MQFRFECKVIPSHGANCTISTEKNHDDLYICDLNNNNSPQIPDQESSVETEIQGRYQKMFLSLLTKLLMVLFLCPLELS